MRGKHVLFRDGLLRPGVQRAVFEIQVPLDGDQRAWRWVAGFGDGHGIARVVDRVLHVTTHPKEIGILDRGEHILGDHVLLEGLSLSLSGGHVIVEQAGLLVPTDPADPYRKSLVPGVCDLREVLDHAGVPHIANGRATPAAVLDDIDLGDRAVRQFPKDCEGARWVARPPGCLVVPLSGLGDAVRDKNLDWRLPRQCLHDLANGVHGDAFGGHAHGDPGLASRDLDPGAAHAEHAPLGVRHKGLSLTQALYLGHDGRGGL